MSTSAIEKRDEMIARMKANASTVRQRAEAKAKKLQNAAVAVGAAYVYGKYEANSRRNSQQMFSIAGLDPDVTIGLASLVFGEFAGGSTGEVIEAAGLGVLCAAGYRRGQQ